METSARGPITKSNASKSEQRNGGEEIKELIQVNSLELKDMNFKTGNTQCVSSTITESTPVPR